MAQTVTPFLWFDTQAEEAANFYASVFRNSEVLNVARHGEGGPAPAGTAMIASFSLDGTQFTALNGGPEFKFTPATSFQIDCESQEEVDYFWDALSEGGTTNQCGWLDDKFGLSWQVVPRIAIEMLQDKDPAKANRVMAAVFQMTKIEIDKLQAAYDGQ